METKTTSETNTAALPKVAEALNQLLADSYALMAQTHLAHWNVEGTDFFQLHEAFQAQYEELFAAIDELAERVRALDFYAAGGIRTLGEKSTLQEGPSESACPAKDFVASLIEGNEICVASAITARDIAAESSDTETEDIIIARIQTHQKTLWFLRSYLK